VQASRSLSDRPALSRKMTRACLDEIAASRADITTIDTWRNAPDVSAVMPTPGHPAYEIHDIADGTKLGQEVRRSAPEGLRSVVLESAAPVQTPIDDGPALPHAEVIRSIFDACTAEARCASAYPDLKARFSALFDKPERHRS